MDASRFDRLNRRAALAGALGIAAIGTFGRASASLARQATPSPTSVETIEIGGQVANPGALTIADVQALPAETVEVTYRMEDGTDAEHTYTGARLWDVLQLAEPRIDPAMPQTSLHMYVVLTARDGYVVVVSMGEIDPEFGAQPYLLAWAEDGQALSGEQGPAMLVPPGDRSEGRYIWGVVSIDVRTVDMETTG